MRRSNEACLAVAAVVCAAGTVLALTARPWGVSDLVPRSEVIVIGTVTRGGEGTAILKVVRKLKGHCPDSISLVGVRKWRARPLNIPPGRTYLLFLTKVETGYRVVGSSRHLEGMRDPAKFERSAAEYISREPWGEAEGGLRLSISTRGYSPYAGRSTWLFLQAKNVSGRALTIENTAPATNSHALVVEGPDGKKTRRQTWKEGDLPSVTLLPREIKCSIVATTGLVSFVTPGAYRLTWYIGKVASNTLTIRVRPAPKRRRGS